MASYVRSNMGLSSMGLSALAARSGEEKSTVPGFYVRVQRGANQLVGQFVIPSKPFLRREVEALWAASEPRAETPSRSRENPAARTGVPNTPGLRAGVGEAQWALIYRDENGHENRLAAEKY